MAGNLKPTQSWASLIFKLMNALLVTWNICLYCKIADVSEKGDIYIYLSIKFTLWFSTSCYTEGTKQMFSFVILPNITSFLETK